MNILFISFGIKEYDGRLAELYSVSQKLGKVTLVCTSNDNNNISNENVIKLRGKKYLSIINYSTFIYKSLKAAKKMKDIDVLIVDNLFASIPSILIKAFFRPRFIIQDVRELYFYNEIKSRVGRMLCKLEVKLMRKADVVLCANKQRSNIMYKKHQLNKYPVVFENIRFLTGDFDTKELDEKYKNSFKNRINIVSTGGLSVLRTTDKLVEAMAHLPKDYVLYIIGEGTEKDHCIIQKIIDENQLSNINLLCKVPLTELRYIVQKCDIGIVNYHKNDLNNQYCASGKVYEFLAEGLPLVTTENIPLKELCEQHGVGEADDEFYNGILKVSENINDYKSKVKSFISEISVEKYNEQIASIIKDLIKGKEKT